MDDYVRDLGRSFYMRKAPVRMPIPGYGSRISYDGRPNASIRFCWSCRGSTATIHKCP